MITVQEFALWGLTALWLAWCFHIRPRKEEVPRKEKTMGEKFVSTIKALTEKPPETAGYDPIKASVSDLKKDMMLALAKERQKKEHEKK